VTTTELQAASEEEVRRYRALVAAYEAMLALVSDEGPLAVAGLTAAGAAADAALATLREVTAKLGPERLATRVAPPPVTALWREAAAFAARAAELNAALAAATAARRDAVAGRLATLAAGRRALAAYRPASIPRTADQRA